MKLVLPNDVDAIIGSVVNGDSPHNDDAVCFPVGMPLLVAYVTGAAGLPLSRTATTICVSPM